MKNGKILLLSLLAVLFAFYSCDKDDETVVNEAEVLVNYLESADSPLGKDYVSTDMPSITIAEDVHTLNVTGKVYIMDIRSADDFITGHIPNAVNVALGDIFTHLDGMDLSSYDKVVIVCYSGQTASFAASLLRIMGYDKVYSLKWGMCSWHTDFAGSWPSHIGNTYATSFTADATAKGEAGDLPELTTGFTTGQEILEARADAVLLEGFSKVTNATVFGSPTDYYIVNYWSEAHYTNPGHYPGAIQYTPKLSMQLAEDLKTLPTDKKIAVYCYTGQTSAYLTAYLRLLGYDAYSVLYGANGMIYDALETSGADHQWTDAAIMDYDYE